MFAPFVLNALCMGVDEFYFHWRRGLPRWERLGHPLDTLTVLVCQAWLCWQTPSAFNVGVYAVLCLISSLFVTKDEAQHQRFCRSGEHWLHAVMFMLHPLMLTAAGLVWGVAHGKLPFIIAVGGEAWALRGNLVMIFLFGLYQLLFWNFVWQRLPRSQKILSTTNSTTS